MTTTANKISNGVARIAFPIWQVLIFFVTFAAILGAALWALDLRSAERTRKLDLDIRQATSLATRDLELQLQVFSTANAADHAGIIKDLSRLPPADLVDDVNENTADNRALSRQVHQLELDRATTQAALERIEGLVVDVKERIGAIDGKM